MCHHCERIEQDEAEQAARKSSLELNPHLLTELLRSYQFRLPKSRSLHSLIADYDFAAATRRLLAREMDRNPVSFMGGFELRTVPGMAPDMVLFVDQFPMFRNPRRLDAAAIAESDALLRATLPFSFKIMKARIPSGFTPRFAFDPATLGNDMPSQAITVRYPQGATESPEAVRCIERVNRLVTSLIDTTLSVVDGHLKNERVFKQWEHEMKDHEEEALAYAEEHAPQMLPPAHYQNGDTLGVRTPEQRLEEAITLAKALYTKLNPAPETPESAPGNLPDLFDDAVWHFMAEYMVERISTSGLSRRGGVIHADNGKCYEVVVSEVPNPDTQSPDTVGEQALGAEVDQGKRHAEGLVGHLVNMGAGSCQIPVSSPQGEFTVTVEQTSGKPAEA